MAKTYLSSDFKLNGNIKSQGDIEIDGQIKGKVVGNSVSVLASGSVDGSITGTSVSVDGKANGVISASDLSRCKFWYGDGRRYIRNFIYR